MACCLDFWVVSNFGVDPTLKVELGQRGVAKYCSWLKSCISYHLHKYHFDPIEGFLCLLKLPRNSIYQELCFSHSTRSPTEHIIPLLRPFLAHMKQKKRVKSKAAPVEQAKQEQ